MRKKALNVSDEVFNLTMNILTQRLQATLEVGEEDTVELLKAWGDLAILVASLDVHPAFIPFVPRVVVKPADILALDSFKETRTTFMAGWEILMAAQDFGRFLGIDSPFSAETINGVSGSFDPAVEWGRFLAKIEDEEEFDAKAEIFVRNLQSVLDFISGINSLPRYALRHPSYPEYLKLAEAIREERGYVEEDFSSGFDDFQSY